MITVSLFWMALVLLITLTIGAITGMVAVYWVDDMKKKNEVMIKNVKYPQMNERIRRNMIDGLGDE